MMRFGFILKLFLRAVGQSAILCLLLWGSSPTFAQEASPGGAKAKEAAPQPPFASPGGFTDITAASRVSFLGKASHTSKKYLIETMGGGVALFDFDNDGLLDIFFVNGAPFADPTPRGTIPQKTGPEYWNRLFHQ